MSMRKKIQKKFRIRGYYLKMDALNSILSFADQFPGDEEGEAIDLLLDHLQMENLTSRAVDAKSVEGVINLLLGAAEEPTSNASSLSVIDAFLVPKYRYDSVTRQFIEHTTCLPVHGEAFSKTELYRERFMLLLQRVSRSEFFSRPVFDPDKSQFDNCEISPIQSLVFQMGKRWVMGVISQLEDGHFYLEDLSASVEIDLTKAKITPGFFTENTIILAEGEMMHDGIFQVIACGFPPLEGSRDKTRIKTHTGFGNDMLTTVRLGDTKKIQQPVNETFVILSDIWLDDEDVLRKLDKVLDDFESVEEIVPSLFVFMGNFFSTSSNLSFASSSSLRKQFGKFGRLIGNHPRLKESSRFLFIPGPHDAGPSTALPRCGLPNYLTQELRHVIPNAIFPSNPCRVKLCNQEIVFFRKDLLYQMRRSCLITPSSADDPFLHLAHTITHQSHLCPLPLMVQPIIWNYDHSLRLYPSPDTIVLGDLSKQKVVEVGGTTCFNPGSFSIDSTFVAYRPSTQEVKLSKL
ncbi:DNA polymerase epsilon subunit B2 [Raphanus sativus]|uniref:DNA polymerase epsilon subunit n=1 Tax=Raphanus sativus TaxID=3726 RepID=A0A6J0JQ24_RAPSA|nr:DNA polymerase epsilon subunit B-like [Raphanus sativus]KAJ4869580.1 DNA polymerase epsilon subunit B2 [Raphanus sativus]